MNILGLNAYHGDSSACVIRDGELIAAVEEERFRRQKHWAGLPVRSVEYCLGAAGITLADVDHIAINRNPKANVLKKVLFAFTKRPSLRLITDRLQNASRVRDIKTELAEAFGLSPDSLRARFHPVEHHVAHLASSFLVSPFDQAAVVSVDGFGDFVGAMRGVGRGGLIDVHHRTFFPHSLGLFYLALTQYIGFPKYGDEYKVMGMAAYGKPSYLNEMRRIVREEKDGDFSMDLDYFIHHSEGVTMTWEGGEPKMGPVFSAKLEELLGPARSPGDELVQRHKDIAASLQTRYEEVFFHMLNAAYKKTGSNCLALSGGCAMNSLANGKIFANTPFKEVYIQPAAGDAGGAIGAGYYVWHQVLGEPRSFVLESPYLGPEFGEGEFREVLGLDGECQTGDDQESKKDKGADIAKNAASWRKKLGDSREEFLIERIEDEEELCRRVAAAIADGLVIGWFQGQMEWGPRALGNRSIVCDPRRADMKNILNLKIKRRESFRPFAPSIHEEATGEYFEINYPDPFMLKVYKIRQEKRSVIPAVTHVDGTGRLQTVNKDMNPRYWRLIDEFRKITDVPVVLNTSFNENEPIVCHPKEALACFLRTRMDILVLGDYMVQRGQ